MKTGTGALLINYGRSKSTQLAAEKMALTPLKMKTTKQRHVMREKMKGASWQKRRRKAQRDAYIAAALRARHVPAHMTTHTKGRADQCHANRMGMGRHTSAERVFRGATSQKKKSGTNAAEALSPQ
jgi:hypothetical protein